MTRVNPGRLLGVLGMWEQEPRVVFRGRNDQKHKCLAYLHMAGDQPLAGADGKAPGKPRSLPGLRRLDRSTWAEPRGPIPSPTLERNLLMDIEAPRA